MSSPGKLSVLDALENVRSERLKERTEGLQELKRVLELNRKTLAVQGLKDKTIHLIYEALFKATSAERSSYVRAAKPNVKTSAAQRLYLCASILRLTVELTVRNIRNKTIKAFIDHIAQTLPLPGGGFCEPLRTDYAKALEIILAHSPHLEHLSPTDWLSTVEFCLEGIRTLEPNVEAASSTLNSRFSISQHANGASEDSQALNGSASRSRTSEASGSRTAVSTLMQCLCLLTSVSNCPSLGMAPAILSTSIGFLQTKTSSTDAHVSAMSTINSILARAIFDNGSLTVQTLNEVLPLLKSLWPLGRQPLRNEIMIFLVRSKSFLLSLIGTEAGASLEPDVESFLEAMLKDYSKFSDKPPLDMDDLRFWGVSKPNVDIMPMQNRCFWLSEASPKADHSWTMTYLMAFMSSWLDSQLLQGHDEDRRKSSGESMFKRQRRTQRFTELTRQISRGPLGSRLCSLQILSFTVQQRSLTENELQQVLSSSLTVFSNGQGLVSSWAMVLVAACTFQPSSIVVSMRDNWTTAWQLASRHITSVTQSRAACGLIHCILFNGLVSYNLISDTSDTILTSATLNGPAVLSDSALALLLALLQKKELHSHQTSSNQALEQMLSWLFTKWMPSSFEERSRSRTLCRNASVMDIAGAISTILGQDWMPVEQISLTILNPVGQAWLDVHRSNRLIRYLLLLEERKNSVLDLESIDVQDTHVSLKLRCTRTKIEYTALRLSVEETERAIQTWQQVSQTSPQTVNADMIYVLSTFCIVSEILASNSVDNHAQKAIELADKVGILTSSVCSFARRPDTGRTMVEAILRATMPMFPDLPRESSSDDISKMLSNFPSFVKELATTLDALKDNPKTCSLDVDQESMELDEIPDFQDTFSTRHKIQNIPRQTIETQSSSGCFYASASTYIQFVSSIISQRDTEGPPHCIPGPFVESLISQSAEQLLPSSHVLQEITRSKFQFNVEDAECLLTYLGTSFLESYDFERCEVAIGLCLSAMAGLAPLWTKDDCESLAETADDIFIWINDILLGKDISSPTVQTGIADLLFALLKTKPDYARRVSRASVRTSLFQVLQDGNIQVKDHVAGQIAFIFSFFVLDQHESILEDVMDSLPHDVDWPEGMCIRLLILSQLASAWRAPLRRCVYHIFETAGHVPGMTGHARLCIKWIANALELSNPSEVFRLFRSQILYTWLESQSIGSIPFAVFEYSSLERLLEDAQEEVVSQLLMHEADEKAKELELRLKKPFAELVEISFGRAAAYAFAKDVCNPDSQGTSSRLAEIRMRNLLGKSKYIKFLQSQFTVIVSHFFLRLEQEDQFDKALAKRSDDQGLTQVLETIKKQGWSNLPIAAGQQPSFKSKYLVDQIERLCRRVSLKVEEIWTPFVVSTIARTLFDDIHPAVGSMHSRRTIQRIRILITLAGATVLENYPLEMLIHALRPFATEQMCSEDAIGLLRYLLSHGTQALSQAPSFVAGTFMSLFISLRHFLETTQDSTTQGSQHLATMSKAQAFHQWLSEYIDLYQPEIRSKTMEKSFQSLMHYAKQVNVAGSAEKETVEGQLLFQLLTDQKAGRSVLSQPFFVMCLGLLCKQFGIPASSHLDIFGSDKTAAEYISEVWKSYDNRLADRNYRIWMAKVIGRSFNYDGHVPASISRETNLQQMIRYWKRGDGFLASKLAIIRCFAELMYSTASSGTGLIEQTLRMILSRSATTDDGPPMMECLPISMTPSLVAEGHFSIPDPNRDVIALSPVASYLRLDVEKPFTIWTQDLAIATACLVREDGFIGAILHSLAAVDGLAERLYPYILHSVLLAEAQNGSRSIRQDVSSLFNKCFDNFAESVVPHTRLLVNTILYLRIQPIPDGVIKANQNEWLDVDYERLARVAKSCKMSKSALLFAELSRDSAQAQMATPYDLLLSIFLDIDEQDSFYGVPQIPRLQSVADRHEYEESGIQGLLFQGAQLDSIYRSGQSDRSASLDGVIKALTASNLNSITSQLLANQQGRGIDLEVRDQMLRAAQRLGQWDIVVPATNNTDTSVLYATYRSIQNATNTFSIQQALEEGFLDILGRLRETKSTGNAMRNSLRSLAALAEIDDVLSSRNPIDIEQALGRFAEREQWMENGQIADVSHLLKCRETLSLMLTMNDTLRKLTGLDLPAARLIDAQVNLTSSTLYRKHGSQQESLAAVTYLSAILEPCKEVGIHVDVYVQYETANVLWDRQEFGPSVRLLQALHQNFDNSDQSIWLGKATLLAKLGRRVSEARLEGPDDIHGKYLTPALQELESITEGHEAGEVFHEFATYCHQQLTNPEILAEYQRVDLLKAKRQAEVRLLVEELKSASEHDKKSKGKSETSRKMQLQRALAKAKKWFEIEVAEYERLRKAREASLRSSVDNYLLSLAASDLFDEDALRFFAIWFEHFDDAVANGSASAHLQLVASHKFTSLMNQLVSRLENTETEFQRSLKNLVCRICVDHPYHSMYQLCASTNTKADADSAVVSRGAAATGIASYLQRDSKAGKIWTAIQKAHEVCLGLAEWWAKDEYKVNDKIPLRNVPVAHRMEHTIVKLKIPPMTMSIDLRPDCNYEDIPVVYKFDSEMRMANGNSAPKIVTAQATDGSQHKQLYKSNDDLRQDAIMEQVFTEASAMLKRNTASRQRNLRIRTYNVLPLSITAGVIEFVQHTIAIHDFLVPAHAKYHPRDLKFNSCRSKIAEAEKLPVGERVKVFQEVEKRYKPVMRHFFFERFPDPNDWFERRLAYTRSNAAISILGHILGLGDRHCHNILLDQKTGEAVHIDLGIAFEAGRILKIPEVVPFRLTRDIVDGFGIMKTEGTFRRCCEFTLEALRKEKDTIMTLLNVLRYDPLYNWTLSPIRAKRIQEEQERQADETDVAVTGIAMSRTSSRSFQERTSRKEESAHKGGEAERALTVVERKLAAGLSVTATVNELILQATDEKNLALLFCGWAAYS